MGNLLCISLYIVDKPLSLSCVFMLLIWLVASYRWQTWIHHWLGKTSQYFLGSRAGSYSRNSDGKGIKRRPLGYTSSKPILFVIEVLHCQARKLHFYKKERFLQKRFVEWNWVPVQICFFLMIHSSYIVLIESGIFIYFKKIALITAHTLVFLSNWNVFFTLRWPILLSI